MSRRCNLLLLTMMGLSEALLIQRTTPIRMMASKAKKKIGAKAKSSKGGAGGFGAAKGFGSGASKQVASIPKLQLNTGDAIPALGFGTYRANGDELKLSLEAAIAAGYRHIDTAQAYQNEEIVGAAIAASGVPREEFFITTKLWGSSHGDGRTQQAIEASLKALGTPYLDLLLLHGPSNDGRSDEEIISLRQQSWLAMEAAHKAGTLRAIGVSNFERRHIESVLEVGMTTPAVNQIEMHAQLGQAELRAFCESHGIVVSAYGSVGAKGLRADPVVRKIAQAHKRTPAQVSLRHTLQARGGSTVVLSKSCTPRRIAENAQCFEFQLSEEEVAAMDALDTGTRSYWDNTDVP
jgi:2,5-diketo-D-gluconate reductase A